MRATGLLRAVALYLLAVPSLLAAEEREVRGVKIEQPELKVVEERCLTCHNRQRIDALRKERRDVQGVIRRMEAKGVKLSPKDRQVIGHFLESPFKGGHPDKGLAVPPAAR